MLPYFRRNLPIGHFVRCFNPDVPHTVLFPCNAFFQLGLRLARAEDQNRVRAADSANDFPIEFIEMLDKLVVQLIISLLVLGAIGSV